jgi:hypothetical protein
MFVWLINHQNITFLSEQIMATSQTRWLGSHLRDKADEWRAKILLLVRHQDRRFQRKLERNKEARKRNPIPTDLELKYVAQAPIHTQPNNPRDSSFLFVSSVPALQQIFLPNKIHRSM